MKKYDIGYTENKKLKTCSACGGPIAKSAKRCPHCGAKNKKPFYKKIWFWVLILLLLGSFSTSRSSTFSVKPSTKPASTEAVQPDQSASASASRETSANAHTEASAPSETAEPMETTETVAPSAPTEALINGMHPDFKAAMDSYEEFIDEYCEFMKKYAEAPDDLSLLVDYAAYMAKLADTMAKLETLDDSEMNNAEMAYYIEVSTRITQKLLAVSNEIG